MEHEYYVTVLFPKFWRHTVMPIALLIINSYLTSQGRLESLQQKPYGLQKSNIYYFAPLKRNMPLVWLPGSF
jgi:hypothetical protein